jgi:hypothetical protein
LDQDLHEYAGPGQPCPGAGASFESLRDRYESQKAIIDQMEKHLKLMQAKLREVTCFYATELREAFEPSRQNAAKI